MTRAVNRRLFQAGAAAALAAIILGLGYLGTRGQPPARNSPAEKLSIALPVPRTTRSTWQPTSLEAQSALGENALSFTDVDANRNTILAVGRNEFLKGYANAIEKFVRAMLKAEQFMRSHPEETQILTAEWLEIDVVALRPTWKQFDFRISLLQSLLTTMEEEARWAVARGYVAIGPVPNFLPHLHLDALLALQPERVTVLR